MSNAQKAQTTTSFMKTVPLLMNTIFLYYITHVAEEQFSGNTHFFRRENKLPL